MNTAFRYHYRDGQGCVYSREYVFNGDFTWAQGERLRAALDDRQYFVAYQLRIPEVFPWIKGPHLPLGQHYPRLEWDHPWHRIAHECFVLTERSADDARTVEELVRKAEAVGGEWDILSTPVAGDYLLRTPTKEAT